MIAVSVIQARIREAKDELIAETRINTERLNQLTMLLKEKKQYELTLNSRQNKLVSVAVCLSCVRCCIITTVPGWHQSETSRTHNKNIKLCQRYAVTL